MEISIMRKIEAAVSSALPELYDIRNRLYEHPETGGQEVNSFKILMDILQKNGFDISEKLCGFPTAFRAFYDSLKPGITVGLAAEYDALPVIGHGCGHNIICTASIGAALGLKAVIDELGGKIIIYGTPGEENICSKVKMADEGVFTECDVLMETHPNPVNAASGLTAAIDAWKVDFLGKASHAGMEPEKGVNALDAAVHFYSLIGFEKQYLKNTNIYGVFASAGEKCSVIPDFASVKYLVRAKTISEIENVREMFERCAEAAAKSVSAECKWKISRNEPCNPEMHTNSVVSKLFNRYYTELGGGEMPEGMGLGSTDMANASWTVPAIHPWLGLNCPDYALHSKEFADMTITPEGDRVIKMASLALAFTGAELLSDRDAVAAMKKEFMETTEEYRRIKHDYQV